MKRLVLFGVIAAFALWLGVNCADLTKDQNGTIRFFLGLFLALAILFRGKESGMAVRNWLSGRKRLTSVLAVLATLTCVVGLICEVGQLEWLGLLTLLFLCLNWALPDALGRRLFPSFLLLYWVHPLPSQVFGPMELGMQKISVVLSEWLLHLFNVRVWADGNVLRSEFAAFEVPAACSGMRTAGTVFLLSLGLGLIKRFKWRTCIAVVVVALFQALILNAVRISTMVALVPVTGAWSGIDFLHNTTGLIMLLAVLLTYAEITAWDSSQVRRLSISKELNAVRMKMLSEYPPFWRWILRHPVIVVLGLIALIAGGTAAYRTRPYHRAQMIMGVVEALRDTDNDARRDADLLNAERGAEVVRQLIPDVEHWEMSRIRILLMRRKYEEVMIALKMLHGGEQQSTERQILLAYANMGLGRLEKARELVDELPESLHKDPRVAMILAEIAHIANELDEVATHIVVASRWTPNTARVRSLYPYLERRRQWRAIMESDREIPYSSAGEALAAAAAYMSLNDMPKLSQIMADAAIRWPDDPRLLVPLFYLAWRQPDTEWSDIFAKHFGTSTRSFKSVDQMYDLFEECFKLARPDLAWILYARMYELDPDHPALSMVLVRYGHRWFDFRSRLVNVPSSLEYETTSVVGYYLLAGEFAPWQRFARFVPDGETFAVRDPTADRKLALRKALDGFKARIEKNELSVVMRYEYARALEIAQMPEEARALLKNVAANHPLEEEKVRILLSESYENQRDWENVYEILRGYDQRDDPQASALIRLCNAETFLRMGLLAIETGERAAELYPDSSRTAWSLARALKDFDSPESALLVLDRPMVLASRNLDILKAETLYLTTRYQELRRFCESVMLPCPESPPGAQQNMEPVPAEMSLFWHHIIVPPEDSFRRNAGTLKGNIKTATSPFFKKLMPLWLECYNRNCDKGSAKIQRWLDCGRDPGEQAIALSQLIVLLCRAGKYDDARVAAEKAVDLLPGSGLLWRLLIGLSRGEPAVVAAARRACPDDPEVWLAELVVRTHKYAPGREEKVWDEGEIIREFQGEISDKEPKYPSAVVVRAGDYLLRRRMGRAAAVAARDASDRARGLISAHVLAIRTAIVVGDRDWAYLATRRAIETVESPPLSFHKKLVELESEMGRTSDGMLNSLRRLRRSDPDNPLWMQMLGYVRFSRGGWELADAMEQMMQAMDSGVTDPLPFSVAAEAARSFGNLEKAADILHRGRSLNPDNVTLLNNLIFVLASREATSGEALKLVPELEKKAQGAPACLDTIVVAYLNAGELKRAERTLKKLHGVAVAGSNAAFRVTMHEAELLFLRGETEEAGKMLKGLLTTPRNINDSNILLAAELLEEIRVEVIGDQ